jgi:stage III sporulation protein AF
MELIRSWILTVTVSAMIIALAEGLMPQGTVKRVGRLTGGLVLMLAILQPLVQMDYDTLFLMANGLGEVVVESREEQEMRTQEAMKTIIEQELSAYALDKAQTLGLGCTVSITCRLGENNVPYPDRAVIVGLSGEAQKQTMMRLLREELDIPDARQTYEGGEEAS